VDSVECSIAEFPLVEQTIKAFPYAKGAIIYEHGKATYCLDVSGARSLGEVKILVDEVRSTIELVLRQIRFES